MPTATDYRTAAASARDASAEAELALAKLNAVGYQTGLVGGSTVKDVVDAAMTSCLTGASTLIIECESTATEFERRAQVCEDYARAVSKFYDDFAQWDGVNWAERPTYPPKPEWWVD